MDNLTNKNDVLTDENDELSLTAQQKIKKRIPLKVISTVFYSIITIAAFAFNILLLVEAIATTKTVTEGWDGLGKAIGLAVLIYLAVIVGIGAVVLYQLPFILSLTGFITSFKTKKGAIRKGKFFFPVLLALTVISEFLIALLTVAIILIIKFKNG